jgi:hypothetical protein
MKEKILKIAKNSLMLISCFTFLFLIETVLASTSPTFNQTISAGSLSVDIVDAGGTTVASPAVTFGAATYSFDTQSTSGSFAPSAERIRAYNPTATATWTVNLGATATDTWTASSLHYDFNDPTGSGYTDGTDTDAYGGEMTVDPSGGTITGVSGCATSNVSAGASDSFEEGVTDSIDIFTAASGASTYCRWDYVGAASNISQKIPAGQAAGSYSLTMVVSIQ